MTKSEMLSFIQKKVKLILRQQNLLISDLTLQNAKMEHQLTTKELEKEQRRLSKALSMIVRDIEFLKRSC